MLPVNEGLLDRVGRRVLASWSEMVEVLVLVGDTVLRAAPALRGRASMRFVDVVDCAWEAGIAALPIVSIVNVLVGGILAFVGAVQLQRFGAGIYVADLIGVAEVREMAALMTAIIMCGRTGVLMPPTSPRCRVTRKSTPCASSAFPCMTTLSCRGSSPSSA